MKKLLELLNSIAPISPALQSHLQSILKRNTFKKRAYLLQAGQVSNHIHFLESGLVRCFYDKEEQEICIWFMEAGNVIISVESFLCQIKSYQYIQALEDCVTWSISYKELQEVYAKFPEFNLHRAVLLEKYYVESEKRQRILSLNSAVERYTQFMEIQPEIMLHLPAKYIASYLNIAEAYFSRIRSKYAG